jgi:hypothetical protein
VDQQPDIDARRADDCVEAGGGRRAARGARREIKTGASRLAPRACFSAYFEESSIKAISSSFFSESKLAR